MKNSDSWKGVNCQRHSAENLTILTKLLFLLNKCLSCSFILAVLFYRDSLALATFALILTALLRKLQNMTIEAPTWISSTTIFVLSNRAGRLLLHNDEESKIAGESAAVEENSDVPRSGMRTKESSWRHFAAIVEWLSFFCVALTYIIILITLMPTP